MTFRIFVLLAVLLASLDQARGARTRVSLLLEAQTAVPGQIVMAGVHLKMPKGWHSYWTNSGDSGAATEIEWELPPGITAADVQWPVPEKHVTPAGDQNFYTYVLEDVATLLVPLQIAKDAAPGPKTIRAAVSWQECETICVLGSATVEASFTVGDTRQASTNAAAFEAARSRLAQTNAVTVNASLDDATTTSATLALTLSSLTNGSWDFFPYSISNATLAGATQVEPGPPARLLKQIKKDAGDQWPENIRGLLVRLEQSKPIQAYEIAINLEADGDGKSVATATALPGDSERRKPLLLILFFAFLGGLILNIMPCVLPVIALKVLSFVNQSKESPGRARLLGLVYGAGVIVSFLVLAAIAIGVKQAGQEASWGMALQNQTFRVVLTILITLVALNLFGLFEITLSGKVMGAAGDLSSREGLPGAFFNGVLATILATPCTAPFLTGAVGFAFTQSAFTILLVFLMVGLGLAAPFVVLCFQPAWLAILPKPGAWMEKFKIAMGFPMLATAVWIFWFTAPRFGKMGVLWLGLFLVILAAAVWVWGEFVQRGSKRKGLAMLIAIGLLAGGYVFALEGKLDWRKRTSYSVAEGSLKESPDGIDWKPWSPEAEAVARQSGRPVLVDFTADNCLNCQVNKATSLEIPATREKLKEINAVALLGDFTDRDPRIAAELKRYQRAGVPLVIVYPADPARPPKVLPPILTPNIVLEALSEAAK